MKLTKNGELYCHFTNTPKEFLQKAFAFWSFKKSMESHAHFPFCTKIQKNSQLQYIGKFCFSRFATSAPLSHDLGESVGRMLRKLGTN